MLQSLHLSNRSVANYSARVVNVFKTKYRINMSWAKQINLEGVFWVNILRFIKTFGKGCFFYISIFWSVCYNCYKKFNLMKIIS